jgi:phytoene dehydrogenase-like protein
MSEYDVVVVGAGPAGLTAGALLASEGRRVVVIESSPDLGGRAVERSDDGFMIQLGGHLVEDSGSGITAIFAHLGKQLVHSGGNTEMPVWNHDRGSWESVRERYAGSRRDLRRVVEVLLDTPAEDFDAWDDRSLREWLLQHTSDQGVIDLFELLAILECLTYEPRDHSASDNLFMRKLHYAERGTAGYSFWPRQGWAGMWQDLADALVAHGGELRLGRRVNRVEIAGHEVRGVHVSAGGGVMPNEIPAEDFVAAPCVISTLPVWNVLDVLADDVVPDWYRAQIELLAQDRFRATWLGSYVATDEPVSIRDRRELCVWQHEPGAGLAGFLFEVTALDPDAAPDGQHLYCLGGVIPATRARDQDFVRGTFAAFEQGVEEMVPGLAHATWRQRHLVHDPTYAVLQKPGLVGRYRPHWRAPGIDGLYFASETFRSRGIGIDRAARAALTTVEDYLGRRIPGLGDTWRY